MEKMMWAKPELNEVTFAANEYVAACWGVGCNTDQANDWEESHLSNVAKGNSKPWEDAEYYTWQEINTWNDGPGTGDAHASAHCGNSGNQVIYDDNNDKIADRMVEIGTEGLGDLLCTIWTDNTFLTEKNIADVKVGDTIYWTTAAGNKIWHHIGKVFESVIGHPNRS
ncbi:MAG: hypothetical protein IJ418_09365 [Clostridia bacterium]|nr:hypothetical protein [Clostridia bacterium]